MNEVWITDIAAVTPLGDDLDTSWRRLCAGECALRPVERFETGGYLSGIGGEVAGLRAAPDGSLLDPLLERLLAGLAPLPEGTRLLLASTKGRIDLLERKLRGAAVTDERLLAASLLADLDRRLGTRGGANVNAACASSTIALARGAAEIAHGLTDAVLVVGIDLLSEFVFSGFSALKGMSPGACRPFDAGRDGLTLGEGGAALLLLSRSRAEREGRSPLARLAGWGVANDAHHVTAPARDGCGLILAVRQALRVAGAPSSAVAGISAHGTGTVFNDQMELTAFSELFGGHLPPLHGVKGAIGHTLGAAGAIEAAFAVCSLRERRLPPTVGLVTPEPVAAGSVATDALPLGEGLLLSTNSGFGGINAALLLAAGGVC